MNDVLWQDARVLVTGARGFIGTHLCRRLVKEGAIVYGVSSLPDPHPSSFVRWSQVDLSDLNSVKGIFNNVRPDMVFHLAGYVIGSQDLENVQPTFQANLTSTVNLLTAAAARPPRRLVLAGSMREPDPTDSTPVACSPYAASKWACSVYARMFHALYHLPVAITRLMMVYGPGQWDVVKLLPYVTVSLLTGTPPSLSSGAAEFDWVFVDDVVEGMLATAITPRIDGRTVELGSGTLTSVRCIVEKVAALVGSDLPIRFGALADRPFDACQFARISETKQAIGWTAQTSLDEGLRQTVAWYRDTWSLRQPA
jgi:nucleoside-diphosphate-sugar epimerase